MDPEKLRGMRFEALSMLANMNGTSVLVTGKMPALEFYGDELCRLAGVALENYEVHELGWLDSLGTVVSFREKVFANNSYFYRLAEYRDATQPPDSLPLQIRYVASRPPIRNEAGALILPTEIKYYFPQTGALQIVRLDHLSGEDLKEPDRLQQAINLHLGLTPIRPTKKDRFFLYAGLVDMAGERLPE